MYLLVAPNGTQFKIEKQITTFGRSKENDIFVEDVALSRNHLKFELNNLGELFVLDLQSQNGFSLNGKLSRSKLALKHNDKIGIGSHLYTILSNDFKNDFNTNFNEDFKVNTLVGEVKKKSNILRVLILLLAIGGAYLYFSPKNKTAEINKSANTKKKKKNSLNEKPLPSNAFKKDSYTPKIRDEIISIAKFKEAMRDYSNGNFVRALHGFRISYAYDNLNKKAKNYESFTLEKIQNLLANLEKDAQLSFEKMQYRRSKAQSIRILSILSDEVTGFIESINRKSASTSENGFKSATQEETLIHLPCEQTSRTKLCEKSISLIFESRKILGEEDVIK